MDVLKLVGESLMRNGIFNIKVCPHKIFPDYKGDRSNFMMDLIVILIKGSRLPSPAMRQIKLCTI